MYVIKASLLHFIQVLDLLIMIRVLMSWILRGQGNKFTEIIYELTEPLLMPFRKLQYKLGINGMLDFSPIFAFLTLSIIRSMIISIL